MDAPLEWENAMQFNLIWLFSPLDMGPKFLYAVLYEYFKVFLITSCKNSILREMKINIHGSKVVLSGEPSKKKKAKKKAKINQKINKQA